MLTEAAGRAGLERVELLAEPVAAALMYTEIHSILAPVAVYDLGAGTFKTPRSWRPPTRESS